MDRPVTRDGVIRIRAIPDDVPKAATALLFPAHYREARSAGLDLILCIAAVGQPVDYAYLDDGRAPRPGFLSLLADLHAGRIGRLVIAETGHCQTYVDDLPALFEAIALHDTSLEYMTTGNAFGASWLTAALRARTRAAERARRRRRRLH